jgi:Mrp family chromosome partitioning ATPase/DUF971 family protein
LDEAAAPPPRGWNHPVAAVSKSRARGHLDREIKTDNPTTRLLYPSIVVIHVQLASTFENERQFTMGVLALLYSLLWIASTCVLPASSFTQNRHFTRNSLARFATKAGDGTDEELPPVPIEWQGQVLQQLKTVIDPDLGSDIVTLGFVQNLKIQDRTVSFDVELTTPACPVKGQFEADCIRLVEELPWITSAQVTMTAQETVQETASVGLSQVGAIIAVSSCKGGVGKSTTAVNLAFSLQALGANVGILDADVYGPSLPTMVTPDDDIVRFVGRQIAPLQRNGVRLMSFGYVNEGSAVMRGPMVSQLLDQFLSVTNWGSLDYLILDMPPGTGDIQLTLTQRLNITAAVIVTTPQELSFADVVRGVEMFDSVNVPCVAVVENMAYYEVERPKMDKDSLQQAFAAKLKTLGLDLNGDSTVDRLATELVQVVQETVKSKEKEQIRIFGAGHTQRLSEEWGIEHTFSVPLADRIAFNGDNGTPFVLEFPESSKAKEYRKLAQAVVSEVAKAKFGGSQRPDIAYNKDEHLITVDGETISPANLRRGCRCAACVEEMTGRQILIATSILETIKPLKMSPTGNYALSVDWSDGHRSLYPYRQIRSMLQAKTPTADKVSL